MRGRRRWARRSAAASRRARSRRRHVCNVGLDLASDRLMVAKGCGHVVAPSRKGSRRPLEILHGDAAAVVVAAVVVVVVGSEASRKTG